LHIDYRVKTADLHEMLAKIASLRPATLAGPIRRARVSDAVFCTAIGRHHQCWCHVHALPAAWADMDKVRQLQGSWPWAASDSGTPTQSTNRCYSVYMFSKLYNRVNDLDLGSLGSNHSGQIEICNSSWELHWNLHSAWKLDIGELDTAPLIAIVLWDNDRALGWISC